MSTYGGLMVFHENSSKQNTYLFVIFNVFWRFVYYYQQHFLMNEQVCLIYVFVWEESEGWFQSSRILRFSTLILQQSKKMVNAIVIFAGL